MTRYLFVSPSPVVLAEPALPDLTALFAADAPFTFWDSRTSGADWSADLFNVAGTALLVSEDLVTDGSGVLPPFRGPDGAVIGWVDFGGALPRTPIVSPEASEGLLLAWLDGTVGGSGIAGAPATWPATFPPDLHTHDKAQITGTFAVGQNLMGAVDQQAARAAIGAGTGNGTSNLVIGTTATTAFAGNRTIPASNLPFTPSGALTATDVQGAIVQASQSSGGGAASAVYVWQYASGAWPALPATKPTGVLTVWGQGPVQPTGTLPAWVGVGGAGAGQATLCIDIVPLT